MPPGRTRLVTVTIVVLMLVLATPAGVVFTTGVAAGAPTAETASATVDGPTVQQTTDTNDPPDAAFTIEPDPPLVGAPVRFNASTAGDPDGEIVSYSWRLNGTVVSDDETFTHDFETAREVQVRLTVRDDDNATASITRSVRIRTEGSLDAPAFLNPDPIEGESAPEFEPIDESHSQVVQFHSGAVTLEPGLDEAVLDTARDRVWVIVQFTERPAWDELHDLGVNRQDVLAYRTYYAGIPTESVETVANRSAVRAIEAVRPGWKRSPGLKTQTDADTERPVTVLTFENVDSLGYGLERIDNRAYSGTLEPDEISELQYEPVVKWIQPRVEFRPTLVAANRLSGARFVKPQMRRVGGIAPGEDVRVAVIDTGIDHDHPHFETVTIVDSYDRPQGDWYPEADAFGKDNNAHGTHVAGIVAGSTEDFDVTRNRDVLIEGVAPNATLVVSRGLNVRNLESVNRNDSDIITNSWGGGSGGRYSWGARWADKWARNHTNVTVLFAYGNYNKSNPNQQWADTPGLAKNIITVGSLNDGTGRIDNPEQFKDNIDTVNNIAWLNNLSQPRDGQTKPDVNAPGAFIDSAVPNGSIGTKFGSSMATPHVAGIAAMLESSIKGKLPVSKTGYTAAETKAIIVGTAGPVENPNPAERPEGHGSANAHNAVYHNRYEAVNRLYSGEFTSGGGISKTHTFTVPNDAEKIVVSLAWTDLAGSTATKDTLVNDLDLYVGPKSSPKQYTVTDRNNTVNRLVIDPADRDTGTQWTVTVHAHAVLYSTPWNTTEPQPYSGLIRVVDERPELSVQAPDEIRVTPDFGSTEETVAIGVRGDGAPVTGVRAEINASSGIEDCTYDEHPRAFVAGMLSDGLAHREQVCFEVPTDEYGTHNVTIRVNSTNAVRGEIKKNVTFVVPKPRVTLEPYTRATTVGGNVTYRLLAKNITRDVSRFKVNVSLRKPEIGAFTDVEHNIYGLPATTYDYRPKNDSVLIEVDGVRVTDDRGPTYHLANITVRGDRVGHSLLDVEVLELEDEGYVYPLRKQSGLEFTAPPDGELIVDSGPPIGVDPDSIQVFERVTFTGPDPGVFEPARLDWDFGDGSTASGNRSINHTYVVADEYNVTLRYVDRYGAIQPHETTVTVSLPPALENLGDSVFLDDASLETPYLIDRIRVDQPLSGLLVEEIENTSDSYSLGVTAPSDTEDLTVHLRTDEIKPLNDPDDDATMLIDRRPQPYYLTRDAAGDLWAAGHIDNFSTRTVTFTTDDPPSIDAGPAIETDEGTTVTRTVSISDPDSSTLTLTVDYGNGTRVTRTVSPGDVDLSLEYVDNGTYPVTLTVEDDHATVTESVTVSVDNVAPTVEATVTDIDEGNATALSANITDPGTADTHTATVNWGDGTVESVSVEGASNTLAATHVYGDNGTYPVTVTVTDDDGGAGRAVPTVHVANLAPIATLNTSSAIALPSDGTAFLGRIDDVQSHRIRASDAGSDDLTVNWTRGGSTTVYNDGQGPDPNQSPGGTYPFTVTDEEAVQFDEPGVHQIAVTVTDDDAATTTISHPKLVTGDATDIRSMGFWRHEYSDRGRQNYSDAERRAFIAVSTFASGVFSERRSADTVEAAHEVLTTRGPGLRGKAEAQALAAWLNFAAGGIGWTEQVDLDGDGEGDRSFASVIAEIEGILSDPGATQAELEHAKDLAEAINT